MAATHTALLPDDGILPPLSILARRAHVFPSMTNNPLLSINQFCDDGYDATFTSDAVLLSKQGRTFSIGTRNPINGLWTVDLSNNTKSLARNPPTALTLHLPLVNSEQNMKTLPDLVQYFHRACFSPVIKTWTQAIHAGFFHHLAWTHFHTRSQTPSQVCCHCKRSLATGQKKRPIHHDNHQPTRHRSTSYDDIGSLYQVQCPNPLCLHKGCLYDRKRFQ
jgi:hypothetical protein